MLLLNNQGMVSDVYRKHTTLEGHIMSLKGTIPGTKSVNDYVTSITTHLKSSSNSWMSIAKDFAEAKGNLNKKEFKQLLEEIHFSRSTVYKLIKIANSKRIKRHEDKLSLIGAWSTLHEIEKLDDEKFAELEKKYLSDSEPRYFQRSDVVHIKNGTCANQKSDFNVLATFKVNLKQIDLDEIEKIQKRVGEFGSSLSDSELVQCDLNDLKSKLIAIYDEKQEKEGAALERKAVRNVKKRAKELIKYEKSKLPRLNRLKLLRKKIGVSQEELLTGNVEEINQAIAEIDSMVGPLTSQEMYA
jgi:hypothetical protein